MPCISCSKCKAEMHIDLVNQVENVIGRCTCGNCGRVTGFEIEGEGVVFVSGKSYGSFNANVSDTAIVFYTEAESCFFSGAPNSSAAMCRASIEAALTEAGYEGKDLYEKIENAGKSKKPNALSSIEVALAHGSRLITRDAIHRLELVVLSDVPSMLSATVHILNKLFPD